MPIEQRSMRAHHICCRLCKSAEIWRRYLAARRPAFDMAIGGDPLPDSHAPACFPRRVKGSLRQATACP